MIRRVKVAAAAEEDLKEIWSYIAERNAEAANGVVREITGKFAILRDYPQMGREQDKLQTGQLTGSLAGPGV